MHNVRAQLSPHTLACLLSLPRPRGAACSNSGPQKGAKTLGGLEGGGGGRWVRRSAAAVPGRGGGGFGGYLNIHASK